MKDFFQRITSRKFLLTAIVFANALADKQLTLAAVIAALYAAVNVYETKDTF